MPLRLNNYARFAPGPTATISQPSLRSSQIYKQTTESEAMFCKQYCHQQLKSYLFFVNFANNLFFSFFRFCGIVASRPAPPPSQPHSSVLRPHFHPHPLPSQPAVNLLYKALLDFVTLLLDFVTTEGALAVVAVQSVSIIYALLCKANALVCIQMFCFTLLCFSLLRLFFLHSGKFQLLWVRNPEAQRSTLF